jgi:hypothetical protein
MRNNERIPKRSFGISLGLLIHPECTKKISQNNETELASPAGSPERLNLI